MIVPYVRTFYEVCIYYTKLYIAVFSKHFYTALHHGVDLSTG